MTFYNDRGINSASVFLPFRVWRQYSGHTCGYCAMAALYRLHGLSAHDREVRYRLGTDVSALGPFANWTGTLPHDLLRVLEEDGFSTTGHRGSWSDVKRIATHLLHSGLPSIALTHMYDDLHWVVITGIDARTVQIADSGASRKRRLGHRLYSRHHLALVEVRPPKRNNQRPLSVRQIAAVWSKATHMLPMSKITRILLS